MRNKREIKIKRERSEVGWLSESHPTSSIMDVKLENRRCRHMYHIQNRNNFLGSICPFVISIHFLNFYPTVSKSPPTCQETFFLQNKLHHLKLIKRKWVYIILVIVQSLLTLNTKYTTPQSNTPSLPETPNSTNVDCLRFVRI